MCSSDLLLRHSFLCVLEACASLLRLAREQSLCRKTVKLCALPDRIYYLVNNRVFFCFNFSPSLPFSRFLSLTISLSRSASICYPPFSFTLPFPTHFSKPLFLSLPLLLFLPSPGHGPCVALRSTWPLKSSRAKVTAGQWTGGPWESSSLKCWPGESLSTMVFLTHTPGGDILHWTD